MDNNDAKRPATEPLTQPNPKRVNRDSEQTVEDLVEFYVNVILKREQEKKTSLEHWSKNGNCSGFNGIAQVLGYAVRAKPPPLGDPSAWMTLMHPEHVHIPERKSYSYQNDEVHNLELLGDKYLSVAALRLISEFGLPHSWTSSLVSTLLSNKYFIQLSTDLGLPDDLPSDINGKIISNTLEVLLKLIFSNMEARFAALSLDPLYLFTKNSIEDHVSHFLNILWRPLLVYTQEIYSIPCRFDNIPTPPYISILHAHPLQEPHQNFHYDTKKVKASSIADCEAHKALCAIMGAQNITRAKPGFETILTVSVPQRSEHPYWRPEDLTNFSWKPEPGENEIKFEVKRWGPTMEHSRYYATLLVEDVIRRVRETLNTPRSQAQRTHSTGISIVPFQKCDLDSCGIYQLGERFHLMWTKAKMDIFQNSMDFWEAALSFMDKEMESHREAAPLITYYKALLLLSANTDFRVSF
jgi:hypothetical protein